MSLTTRNEGLLIPHHKQPSATLIFLHKTHPVARIILKNKPEQTHQIFYDFIYKTQLNIKFLFCIVHLNPIIYK